MRDDDLRRQLARVDPAPTPVTADDAGTEHARRLLEAIMTTPLDTAHEPLAPPARPRRWLMPAAIAGAVGVLAVGAGLAMNDSDTDSPKKQVVQAAPMKLTAPGAPAGGGGPVMSSCIMFDVAILKDMPLAFGGVVTSVAPGKVVLDVDHWFKPADNDVTTVELATADGNTVALDGVEFIQGKRYLVTATDGNVNTCGYTGEATAELESSFTKAFGS